jgi:hypothetical protein
MDHAVDGLSYLDAWPALQRFALHSRAEFNGLFVDQNVYDHILGDEYQLAVEVRNLTRNSTLGGLGFFSRYAPRAGSKRTFPHIIYVGSGEGEPAEVSYHVFDMEIYELAEDSRLAAIAANSAAKATAKATSTNSTAPVGAPTPARMCVSFTVTSTPATGSTGTSRTPGTRSSTGTLGSPANPGSTGTPLTTGSWGSTSRKRSTATPGSSTETNGSTATRTVDGSAAASLIIGKGSIPVAASLVIGKGFILRSLNSVPIALQSVAAAFDEDQVDAHIWAFKIIKALNVALDATESETAEYVFERPYPPLPPHGWARKALRREPSTRFTQEQKAFLEKHFKSSLTGGERMRDKKVHKLMLSEFGRRRGEDDRSLVLKQSQIRGYFSRRAASMKRGAVDASLRGDDGDGNGDGDDTTGDDDDAEYEGFKVKELQDMLCARGLLLSGKKAMLIDRLRADDNGLGSDEEDEPPSPLGSDEENEPPPSPPPPPPPSKRRRRR